MTSKMVPREPTEEMVDAAVLFICDPKSPAEDMCWRDRIAATHRAMFDAAPAPIPQAAESFADFTLSTAKQAVKEYFSPLMPATPPTQPVPQAGESLPCSQREIAGGSAGTPIPTPEAVAELIDRIGAAEELYEISLDAITMLSTLSRALAEAEALNEGACDCRFISEGDASICVRQCAHHERAEDEVARLTKDAAILQKARALTKTQADDESLWFIAGYISENYLQLALRELHAIIEGDDAAIKATKGGAT